MQAVILAFPWINNVFFSFSLSSAVLGLSIRQSVNISAYKKQAFF